MDAPVVPTLGVDRVRTENLQFAPIKLVGKRANYPTVFVFEKFPHRCGKNKQGHPCVPEHERFHVAVKFLAVTFVIFAVHRERNIWSRDGFENGPRCSRSILPDEQAKSEVSGHRLRLSA
jgi:hypothetical protein